MITQESIDRGAKEMLHSALWDAVSNLKEYSYQQTLYSVLRQLGIKNIKELITEEISVAEFYDAIYESVRNEQEEEFSEKDLEEIENNIKGYNNSVKWERYKQKM